VTEAHVCEQLAQTWQCTGRDLNQQPHSHQYHTVCYCYTTKLTIDKKE